MPMLNCFGKETRESGERFRRFAGPDDTYFRSHVLDITESHGFSESAIRWNSSLHLKRGGDEKEDLIGRSQERE